MTKQVRLALNPEDPLKESYWMVGLELILAFALGFGFFLLGTGGGAWVLGGIAAGAIVFHHYRSHRNPEAKPNKDARKIGQALIGLSVGFAVQKIDFSSLSQQVPALILLAFSLLMGGSLIGYLYSRVERTDLLTATLATTPGNIGVMASMAADYGRNPPLVSLVQLIRFTSIIFIVPAIAHVSRSHDPQMILSLLERDLAMVNFSSVGLLAAVLILAAGAVYLGTRLKIPVANLFCPMLVGICFNSGLLQFSPIPLELHLPSSLNMLGQVLLGVTIGEFWGMNPRLQAGTVMRALVPVSLTCLVGFLGAGLLNWLTPWDWLTCLLVASPGGSPEMLLIALTLHHNVEIVTAGHLVRLLAINLSIPALISAVCYLETRLGHPVLTPETTEMVSQK